MANLLKMTVIQSILSLHAQRWSHRRIAETLAFIRRTVSRYVRQQRADAVSNAPARRLSRAGSMRTHSAPLRRAGPFSGTIRAIRPLFPRLRATQRNQSLSALAGFYPGQARTRPLRRCGFIKTCAASRVPRLSATTVCGGILKRLGAPRPLPFRRMECEPGDEAQIDFGAGARITTPDGKRRKTHVLRVVLSHSRKGYSEACFRQTAEDFLRVLENAFWHFGGVPKTLVVDNLKAAVLHADWFDPELNPKLQSFAEHYGTVILPTKPRTPRHKGKVERGVAYVQDNGLKARVFTSLEEQNRHLLGWEAAVADTRIHGTTKQQVGKVFVEVEQAALLPLPAERLPVLPRSAADRQP